MIFIGNFKVTFLTNKGKLQKVSENFKYVFLTEHIQKRGKFKYFH